jgi:hypothetical protein
MLLLQRAMAVVRICVPVTSGQTLSVFCAHVPFCMQFTGCRVQEALVEEIRMAVDEDLVS